MSPLSPSPIPMLGRAHDVVCFSHLGWDFVYQRPQHLMTRCAAQRRVFYIQEPVRGRSEPRLDHRLCSSGVHVVVLHIPDGCDESATLEALISNFFRQQEIQSYWLWYYTPMALPWTRHLKPVGVIYDCMDELSAFKNAPPQLRQLERELLSRSQLVFTGGMSLFEAKRDQHPKVYPFPSSIDVSHFAKARRFVADPDDQKQIPHPRLGFCGVIDERMDLDLLTAVAYAKPDWHWVMLGPVVKISHSDLPQRSNVHYLGMKAYSELPNYLAGWDVAVLPFARNESTRFISPTKTPEYLAAGRPVVSTSIRDVVTPYATLGLVHIADDAGEFIAAVKKAIDEDVKQRLRHVDALLAQNSWSRTWGRMAELMDDVIQQPAQLLSRPSFEVPVTHAASLRAIV